MGTSLFDHEPPPALPKDVLGAGTAVLAGFALGREEADIEMLFGEMHEDKCSAKRCGAEKRLRSGAR